MYTMISLYSVKAIFDTALIYIFWSSNKMVRNSDEDVHDKKYAIKEKKEHTNK